MSHPPRLEKRVEIDAPIDRVWQAISTGPGFATWYVPHEVEPATGGPVRIDFGPGGSREGRVLACKPGESLTYGGFAEQGSGRPDYAYEFHVESAAGVTVLRLVQTGFLDDEEWDAEYDALDAGWDVFLHNLVTYFRCFPGRPVTSVIALSLEPLDRAEGWSRLLHGLGVPAAVTLADRVRLTPAGLDPIDGVVDVLNPGRHLGVRSAAGMHRFSSEGAELCGVSAYHYYCGPVPADPAAHWQAWLDRAFRR